MNYVVQHNNVFMYRKVSVFRKSISDNKCIVCSDGFYTLDENQKSCDECPENAVCTDGYQI